MGASHGRGAGLGLGPWRGRIAAPAAGPPEGVLECLGGPPAAPAAKALGDFPESAAAQAWNDVPQAQPKSGIAGVLVVSYTAYPSTFWRRSCVSSWAGLRAKAAALCALPAYPLPGQPAGGGGPRPRGGPLSGLPAPLAVRLGCCRSDLQPLYCVLVPGESRPLCRGLVVSCFTLLRGEPQVRPRCRPVGCARLPCPASSQWSQRSWRMSGAFLLKKGERGLIV